MSNQLTVVDLVDNQQGLFLPVLSDETISWEKEKQFSIQALQNNDFLCKTAFNNPTSFQNAIINVASIGVSLNPAKKHAYLVPRDGRVCLDVSYMGLLNLAMACGAIKWGQSKLVREKDTYTNNGLDKSPSHSYSPFGDRGEIVGAYCTVKTPYGDYLTEEMSIEDILKIKESSKAKNGPWKNHFNEMARKTVVKRAYKYWPNVDRLDKAIHMLNEDNGEGLVDHREEHLNKVVSLYEENAQPLVIWGYMQQFIDEPEDYSWISSKFPKGHKTKIAARIKEGRDQFYNYKAVFTSEDELAINECVEELSELEYKIIQKYI